MLHIVWVQVSAGVAHSLFVGQAGQLWGCGSNAELQLSQEQSMSSAPTPLRLLPTAAGQPVRFAVAGGSHSLAVLEKRPHTSGQLRRSIGGQPLASSGWKLPDSFSKEKSHEDNSLLQWDAVSGCTRVQYCLQLWL